MARFAVLSIGGDGFSLARRLKAEGHRVDFWCRELRAKRIGAGLIDRMVTPDPVRGSTVIIDGTGMAELGQRLRARGLPVFGGNPLETWETNRALGTHTAERLGLAVPDTQTFTSLQQADAYLAACDPEEVFYFKPDGDVAKSWTCKDTAPMLRRTLAWGRETLAKVPRFELQRPVLGGTEVDVACWLDGRDVVATEVTLEEKKFMPGDVGPSTGCQSNLVWDVPVTTRLVNETLAPFFDQLLAAKYAGMFSVNCILRGPDVYFLEATARLGYDSTQAAMALWGEDFGEQLDEMVRGGLGAFTRNTRDMAMTLRVSVPPQPLDDSTDDRRLRGRPFPPTLLDDPLFFPDDIALGPLGPQSASGSGHVGVFATVGRAPNAMRADLLKRAKDAGIREAMYRSDPVSRADRDLAALRDRDAQSVRAPGLAAGGPPTPRPLAARAREDRDASSSQQPGSESQGVTSPTGGIGGIGS